MLVDKTVVYIPRNTWAYGNTRFISRVENDVMFSSRNKSGISAHPRITLYLMFILNVRSFHFLFCNFALSTCKFVKQVI